MKVPRDINAERLITAMKRIGYTVVRQTGSHIRLSKKSETGEHNITIPNHKPIKIGTLHGIASDLCNFNKITIQEFFNGL